VQERFQPLHGRLLCCLTERSTTRKTLQLQDPIIKLVAGYMPYYKAPKDVLSGLLSLPPLSSARNSQHHVPDYMVYEFAAHLRGIPSVGGLLRYLNGLELVAQTLGPGDLFQDAPKAALENQLYFLSLPGGPRYCISGNALKCHPPPHTLCRACGCVLYNKIKDMYGACNLHCATNLK
jgi:hypothetical protein